MVSAAGAARRRTLRVATAVCAVLTGAAIVTSGGLSAMRPMSQGELASLSCSRQEPQVRFDGRHTWVSVAGTSCVGRVLRVRLLGAHDVVLADEHGKLRHPVDGAGSTAVASLPVPATVDLAKVRRVDVRVEV